MVCPGGAQPALGARCLVGVRRTLVWIAMIGALGVLAIRVWPAPEADPARTLAVEEAPGEIIQLASRWDVLDEVGCAGPALRELRRHPHWQFTLQERVWDDVVDDSPDETLATLRISADAATWTDGDLPQSLELDAKERAEVLAAAERSCVEGEPGPDDGYSGHYVTISYGPMVHNAIELPSRSRAAKDVLAVLDHVRSRYVEARLAAAHAMTLTLTGPRRRDDTWTRYTLTVRGDGRVLDHEGEALQPLASIDLVDVLDWALQLPDHATGPYALTGTLEIAGTKKRVGFQMAALADNPSAWRSQFLELLRQWLNYNLQR